MLDLPADCSTFLSWLLFHSAAISATKVSPSGDRYALRVNPSSGNLHPTEFHFVTRGVKDWQDGLYHYRASSHMAEQRALGRLELPWPLDEAPLVFVLTSIAWREAWKYRDRAYRYCLLDIGHAWQALELAAQAAGCEVVAYGGFDDDALSDALGLPDDEWPMLVVAIRGVPLGAADPVEPEWFGGDANVLSETVVPYPRIDGVHAATKSGRSAGQLQSPNGRSGFSESVVRRRRSALDFIGGKRSMSRKQFDTLVDVKTRLIQLYAYVHLVDNVEPGLYRITEGNLELLKAGDQRLMAAALSLGQDLAGNACVAFSMAADLEQGYREAFFEAGAIGQHFYVAATSMGLAGTGIGAFYDDRVHEYLGLEPDQGQVVYHFAVGYPVPDDRLEE